jgi:uroporphyrinogen III methyltransferase/synthase
VRPVIITRPKSTAQSLAQAVRDAGYRAILFPTIHIGPAPDLEELRRVLRGLAEYKLVVFVSPNAINGALDALEAPWPAGVPIAVMGPGSRAALRERGITDLNFRVIAPGDNEVNHASARFDSEALYEMLDLESLGQGPVLFVKGNGGRTWLSDRVRDRGIAIRTVQSYTRSLAEPDPDDARALCEIIEQERAAQVILTSSESVENLLVLVERLAGASGVVWLKAQRLVVPHARIAENATAKGFSHIELSSPGDGNIVRALK